MLVFPLITKIQLIEATKQKKLLSSQVDNCSIPEDSFVLIPKSSRFHVNQCEKCKLSLS